MLHFSLMMIAALSPTDGKVVAQDDWQGLTILAVGGAERGGPQYVRVAAGDLDGDGRGDDAVMKILCSDGMVKSALLREIKGSRDSGSGMPTGKRQHGTVTFVKEWGPATPQLRAMKASYDVKKMEGARVDADGWRPVSLSGVDGLCPATEAAATIVKSKSNITNN